jgi:hypothetical protein
MLPSPSGEAKWNLIVPPPGIEYTSRFSKETNERPSSVRVERSSASEPLGARKTKNA